MNPKYMLYGLAGGTALRFPVSPRTQIRTLLVPNRPREGHDTLLKQIIPAWLWDRGTPTIREHEIAEAERIKLSIPLCIRDGHDQTIPVSGTRTANDKSTPARFLTDRLVWWEEGNAYSLRPRECRFSDGIYPAYPLFKCAVPNCTDHTVTVTSPKHPFEEVPIRYCREHVKAFRESKEVALGSVYSSNLPPELVKHVTSILANPDGMSAREELATSKALTGKIMAAFAAEEGGLDDPKKAAALISMLDKVTVIAERQAKIAERQDNFLNYKQVLVLLSSAVERMLTMFGKNEDARNTLLTILPDLPWPAGVARVTGVEGLIGQKGQLLLPKPREQQALTVEAKFDGLDVQHVSSDSSKHADRSEGGHRKEYISEAELLEIAATPVPAPQALRPIHPDKKFGHAEPIVHYGDVQEDGFAPFNNRPPAPEPPDAEDHFSII